MFLLLEKQEQQMIIMMLGLLELHQILVVGVYIGLTTQNTW